MITSSFKTPIYLAIFLFSLSSLPTLAQTTIVKDSPVIAGTTVVIAGKHYVRSGITIFFGASITVKNGVHP